jgi:hypothetical protein
MLVVFFLIYKAAHLSSLHIPLRHLKLGDKIGSGVFANVFRAQYGGQTVAVKVMHDTMITTKQDIVDFGMEVKVLSYGIPRR